MKKSILCGFLVSIFLAGMPAYSLNDVPISDVSSAQEASSISKVLTAEEEKSISDLADNVGLPFEKLKSAFSFKVGNKNCFLVPICDIPAHRDCMIKLFSKADRDYMKYYMSGRIKTPKYINNWFARSLAGINRKYPRSMTFLINVDGTTVGRIGIGPLSANKNVNPEIGYALEKSHSGQGIMSAAVKTTLDFLQYLKSNAEKNYKFTRIRATAKPKNIASNSILRSRGFTKSKALINDGYGLESEYFYYFT